MTHLTRLAYIIILFLGFSTCSLAHPVAPQEPRLITKNYGLPNFSGIYVNGPLNVKIVNEPFDSSPNIHIEGDPKTVSYIRTHLTSQNILTLRLSSPPYKADRHSRISVVIHCGNINYLESETCGSILLTGVTGLLNVTANGNGSVTILGHNIDLRCLHVGGRSCVFIQGINSCLLNVLDSSSGSVNLQGFMTLHNLCYSGCGLFRAYWINSSYVHVIGTGRGRISLGGVAGLLEATLSSFTHLNARFLRACRAVINTRGISQADVWSHTALFTLATEHSNIYSHSNTGNLWYHMRPPGAVLRMTRIDKHKFPRPPHPCFTNDYYKECDSYGVDCF